MYKVLKDDDNTTVKHILKDKLNISSRLIIRLKLANEIYVNSNPCFVNHIVHEHDIVEANINFQEEDNIIPQEMNLSILYEDAYLLAINKPAGIVVHPSSYHPENTLANGVKYYLNNKKKIRPINRLDRETSGIVLFAKNEYIQEYFISKAKIKKKYIAVIAGIIEKQKDTINAPIARRQDSIMERCVSKDGQLAITHYSSFLINKNENYSILKVFLETGRTHQIRVHMAYINHPILGDTLYGNMSNLINRQALHAYKICFIHPITNKQTVIIAPIPEDIKKLI